MPGLQVEGASKVLEAIEKELKKKAPKQNVVNDKSNQFYTLIPHDFGEDRRFSAHDTRTTYRRARHTRAHAQNKTTHTHDTRHTHAHLHTHNTGPLPSAP